MKYLFMLMSIFAVPGAITGRADDVLPPRFNFNRYSAMVDHSPFAIATAVALPSATADFAKDLYVANAAHSPEGDMVTIASSADQNFKKYLTTTNTVDGYSISSIEWSDRVGATKVTISKDGNLATLTFNQALLSQTRAEPNASGEMPSNARLISPTVKGPPFLGHGHRVAQQDSTAAAAATPTPVSAAMPNPMSVPPDVAPPSRLGTPAAADPGDA